MTAVSSNFNAIQDGTTTETDVDAAENTFAIPCIPDSEGRNSGEFVDAAVAFTDNVGYKSIFSIFNTFMCANVPQSPSTPRLLVMTLDLILLEWDPPTNDGGSPILGY